MQRAIRVRLQYLIPLKNPSRTARPPSLPSENWPKSLILGRGRSLADRLLRVFQQNH